MAHGRLRRIQAAGLGRRERSLWGYLYPRAAWASMRNCRMTQPSDNPGSRSPARSFMRERPELTGNKAKHLRLVCSAYAGRCERPLGIQAFACAHLTSLAGARGGERRDQGCSSGEHRAEAVRPPGRDPFRLFPGTGRAGERSVLLYPVFLSDPLEVECRNRLCKSLRQADGSLVALSHIAGPPGQRSTRYFATTAASSSTPRPGRSLNSMWPVESTRSGSLTKSAMSG